MEESEARAVLAAYQAAARTGNPDEYVALFHEDAIQCTTGRAPVVGRDALRELAAAVLAASPPDAGFTIEPEQVDVLGDVAVIVAHPRTSGDPPRDLTALFVLRRDAGRWLIWRQAVMRRS